MSNCPYLLACPCVIVRYLLTSFGLTNEYVLILCRFWHFILTILDSKLVFKFDSSVLFIVSTKPLDFVFKVYQLLQKPGVDVNVSSSLDMF